MRMFSGLALSGAAMAFFALVAPAFADAPLAFDRDITLSATADAKLKWSGEGITVLASFYGDPSETAKGHSNEVGMVDLAKVTIRLPGKAGGRMLAHPT